jgi:maltose/moltooligosaccharide transporter
MKGILWIVSALFRLSSLILISRKIYVLSLGLIGLGGLAMLISGLMQKNNTDNGFVTIMNDFQFIKIMKQFVQFFSWFALFMWIYTVPAVYNTFMAQQTTSEAYNTVPIK